MKPHFEVLNALESLDLNIQERVSCCWTGGLTASVGYTVRDTTGKIIASAGFHYNRHPATYRKQGLYARRNTARYEALGSIAKQLASVELPPSIR